jgi:hypothetical protein
MAKADFQLLELTLDLHSAVVLDFLLENRDFFEQYENAVPSETLVKEMFTSTPASVPAENKLILGCFNRDRLVAIVDLVKDRYRAGEWLLSLLILSRPLRKTIRGGKVLLSIFDYIKLAGATTVIGGVVESNEAAKEFWRTIGAVDTGKVYNQNLNGKSVPTRTMYKTL